jgi:hypothetical protein
MPSVKLAGSLSGAVMPNTLDALLKQKPVMIVAAIAAVCFCVYCISDFASMARKSHTQGLLNNMNGVMKDVEKLPPGTPRAEELVRRLKALDPGSAPTEVKQALRDYTAALGGSLEAMKTGRETTQYDASIADAKQKLADCFHKYR